MKLVEILSPPADGQGSTDRRRGHHAYQVAVDTIAYAHNIPFRILLVDKLASLPEVIKSQFEEGASGLDLMNEEKVTKNFIKDPIERQKLFDKNIFDKGVSWVLTLATGSPAPRPDELPNGWESAMLLLLPHLERAVWLTEIGNPLPAHALARMLEHWSLYVLFWCYEQTKNGSTEKRNRFLIDVQDECVQLAGALGIEHYVVTVGQRFNLPSSQTNVERLCAPVVGPYWKANSANSAKVHEEFVDVLERFVSNMTKTERWVDVRDRIPDAVEMRDALQSRIDLFDEEAKLRSLSCRRAFVEHFLQVETLNTPEQLAGLCRQDWEVIAVLCSWWARWSGLITSQCDKSGLFDYWLGVRDSTLGVQVNYTSGQFALNLLLEKPANLASIDNLRAVIASGLPGVTVDSPDVYLNRTRERQNASWTAQVIAVNNLMNSHSGRLVDAANTVGSDSSSDESTGFQFEEANHLLRGYGGKVCHHLISMTRADVADLYWLDYSQTIPTLVHAGGYARLMLHRVKRKVIHQQFANWSLQEKDPKKNSKVAAEQGRESDSQAYRVVSTRVEDPAEGKRTEAWSNSVLHRKDHCVAYFDGFPDPKPSDSLALPLFVHGRVVGVLTLAGLSKGQFDSRLFVPLRRVANLLALSMYQASQLWHMRKLNWLVAHESFANWRQHNEENQFNPLKKISACLTNVFLCRAVHIWLRREDSDEIYALHGYNQEEIFSPRSKKLTDAPIFKYVPGDDEAANHPIERAFVAFAEDVSAKGKANLGRYVQARLNINLEKTNAYSQIDALQGIYLGQDYLTGAEVDASSHGKLRTRIFKDFQLTDLMGFALLQAVSGNPDKFELSGGITLHDSAQIGDEVHPQPWPQAWAPVVAHVQTYLPYLFSQVELLHNPLDHTRRFLLHAGRSELLAVRDNMVQLRFIANEAFDPNGTVRKRVRLIQKMGNSDIGGQAASVEKHLSNAWSAANELIDDSFLRNLDFLVKAIERHKDASALANFEISASSEWVDLEELLKKTLANHHDALAKRGLREPGLFGFDVQTQCLLPRIWLNQIVLNLVENAGKYARDLFNISWDPDLKRLRFVNHGRYDANLDIENRLLRYGVRGSAIKESWHAAEVEPKPGLGVGLWGVQFLCELCQLKFKMTVTHLDKNLDRYRDGSLYGLASYQFDITFPPSIIKEPPGGAAR